MSQQPPEQSSSAPMPAQNQSQEVRPQVNVQAELQNIRRIVNGANKRLDRLCNSIGKPEEPINQK